MKYLSVTGMERLESSGISLFPDILLLFILRLYDCRYNFDKYIYPNLMKWNLNF